MRRVDTLSHMVILRPTRKLRSMLPTTAVTGCSDTALGDWYVNRILVGRQPLLLLVSSTSLLSIVTPARDIRGLPRRLDALIHKRLRRFGLPEAAITSELSMMQPVTIAPTIDRSVLGIMTDFTRMLPYYLHHGPWSEITLANAEDRLAENPCYAGREIGATIVAERKAPELLGARWLLSEPRAAPAASRVVH
jgi:hypothetical protein